MSHSFQQTHSKVSLKLLLKWVKMDKFCYVGNGKFCYMNRKENFGNTGRKGKFCYMGRKGQV